MAKISIRKLTQALAVTSLACAAIVVAAIAYDQYISHQRDQVLESRYASYLLADELRQSSDDLTRLARTYVVTGEAKYEAQYNDILAIRNGEKERPSGYNGIYWDFAAADRPVPASSGVTKSLLDLMRDAGFSKAEFDFLEQAQANSDGLVSLEVRAMNAVKGIFADANGKYTVKGEPDPALAIELLHSSTYHSYKADIMEPVDAFFRAMEGRFSSQLDALATKADIGTAIVFFAAAVLLCNAVASAVVMARRVLKPLLSLSEAMLKMGEGEDVSEIPGCELEDEFGAMARQTRAFKGRSDEAVVLAAQVRDESERARQAAELQKEAAAKAAELAKEQQEKMQSELQQMEAANRFQNDLAQTLQAATAGNLGSRVDVPHDFELGVHIAEAVNDTLDTLERTLASIAEAMGHIAQGELSVAIRDSYPGRYGEVLASAEKARSTLVEIVGSAQHNFDDLSAGTMEISGAINELSRRTETAAATIEQTSAALTELNTSVASVAEATARVDTVLAKANETAKDSDAILSKAVDSMESIADFSQKIGTITDVINDIAFQTNLLALNAGVEAARAGEAGRGFAVVASEVRALAQRASEAALDISSLISNSDQQVQNGVRLVSDTSSALQAVIQSIQNISSDVTHIAQSTREQAIGMDEIGDAVSNIDSVSQSNSSMVLETTSASKALLGKVEALKREFTWFKIAGSAAGSLNTAHEEDVEFWRAG